MMKEKWKLVGGNVYRLAQTFDEMIDAITLAREMKEDHHVFISKTTNGQWAVYWRYKKSSIECDPKYYSV
ncbi:hypothetical protein EU527_00095 [Candidatus Thorarchaeota archaeon]|nr:MAG: hypothetical protein EU527_00095 [Candidatus Thorarchaeota archaeon]